MIDSRDKAIKRCVGFFLDFAGKPGAALQPVVGQSRPRRPRASIVR